MEFSMLKFVIVAVLCLGFGYTQKLPEYFPKCHQNDPLLSDCIQNATNTMRPYLVKGIPELDIASIEPLVVPMIKLEQGTKRVNYKAMLKNVTIHGLSSYNFTDMYVQTDMFAINGNVKFDTLKLESDYYITGRFLRSAVHGMGLLTGEFNGTTCAFTLRGQVMQRKGTEYYSNFNTTLDLQVENGEIELGSLFNGDKALSKKTNDYLKEHGDKLALEIKPAVETVVGMYVGDIMQKISSTISFNDLLPRM